MSLMQLHMRQSKAADHLYWRLSRYGTWPRPVMRTNSGRKRPAAPPAAAECCCDSAAGLAMTGGSWQGSPAAIRYLHATGRLTVQRHATMRSQGQHCAKAYMPGAPASHSTLSSSLRQVSQRRHTARSLDLTSTTYEPPYLALARSKGTRLTGSVIWLASSSSTTSNDWPSRVPAARWSARCMRSTIKWNKDVFPFPLYVSNVAGWQGFCMCVGRSQLICSPNSTRIAQAYATRTLNNLRTLQQRAAGGAHHRCSLELAPALPLRTALQVRQLGPAVQQAILGIGSYLELCKIRASCINPRFTEWR